MKFLFETTTTMKPYNAKKWWISGDIIPRITIDADNVKHALKTYQEIVLEKHYITISNNAIKTANPMYIDDKSGESTQCGYVITAKTTFDNDRRGWVDQYIDLWVNISIISNPWETEGTP